MNIKNFVAAIALSAINEGSAQITPFQSENPAITSLTLPFIQKGTCINSDFNLTSLSPKVKSLECGPVGCETSEIVGYYFTMAILIVPGMLNIIYSPL